MSRAPSGSLPPSWPDPWSAYLALPAALGIRAASVALLFGLLRDRAGGSHRAAGVVVRESAALVAPVLGLVILIGALQQVGMLLHLVHPSSPHVARAGVWISQGLSVVHVIVLFVLLEARAELRSSFRAFARLLRTRAVALGGLLLAGGVLLESGRLAFGGVRHVVESALGPASPAGSVAWGVATTTVALPVSAFVVVLWIHWFRDALRAMPEILPDLRG